MNLATLVMHTVFWELVSFMKTALKLLSRQILAQTNIIDFVMIGLPALLYLLFICICMCPNFLKFKFAQKVTVSSFI